MTDQRDLLRRTSRDYMRSEDGSWGILPILIGAAFVLFLGYLLLGPGFGPRTEPTVTSQRSELPNAVPSAPSVPTPAPPTQQ
jgi:hypothetical protein